MQTLDDTDLMLARGKYATVKGEHKDRLAELQQLCGRISPAQLLRRMQPDYDAVPESIDGLINEHRAALDSIQSLAYEITRLAKDRADLKILAWGKK